MALPTYLELVNEVLVRLREPEVTTVNQNALSKLIGAFVNDSKRSVEDAYHWNALKTTVTASTVATVSNYALTGTGARFKVIDVYNATERSLMIPKSTREMNEFFVSDPTAEPGIPVYYSFKGVDSNGDTKVDVYPVPNAVYSLSFYIYNPQNKLSSDGDTLLIPSEPVIQQAYARALVERGEDGGLSSSEAYALYKQILTDYISIESSRYPEEETWEST